MEAAQAGQVVPTDLPAVGSGPGVMLVPGPPRPLLGLGDQCRRKTEHPLVDGRLRRLAVLLLLGGPLAMGLLAWGVDRIGAGIVLAIILMLAFIGLMVQRLREEEEKGD
jgi:hypothetical protein